MEFGLLGPFEARTTAGTSLPLRRRQERSVLAVLLLEPGRVVGSDRLVELLWEDSPSARAKATVHSHVSRIRSALRAAGVPESEARLASQGNGYLLEVAPDAVDVHRFQAILERVRGTDDLAVRSEWLRTALSLWRGPALADAGTEEFRLRLGSGLEELRSEALAERIDADLGLGRHGSLVPELTALVGENPFRERLRGQLMLALYRSGRRADALEAYRQGHRAATEALGLPPGPELRRLEQAILTDDSTLLTKPSPAPAAQPRSAAPPPVLAQLPARIATFTGRAEHLDQLDAILSRSADQTAAVVISAIAGTAGVGKTALAVFWAHSAAERFPDGQLYVNLRGFDPSGSVLPPADAVRGFLDALGVPPQRIPAGLEAQAALYRSTLTGRRVLILLDNARDAEQVRPLLPGSPGCLVLVTSRNQLPGLVVAEGAHPITLDLLSTLEARQLLTSRLGAARIRAEPRAVDEIVALCARLPLALTIVAARAAMNPRFSLAGLAGELRDARGGLDAFALGDAATDARSVFSWSHRALGDGAARLFRLLGVHPGPDVTAAAAASLAGVPIGTARTLLAELTRANLLSEPSPGRYAFHDLLRAYAAELAAEQESESDRRAAVQRLLDHYLHTADTAYRLVEPHGQRITLTDPATGVVPERPADHAGALAWFDAERAVLLASVRLAANSGFDTHTWHLALVAADYFDRQGHWHDWATVQNAALDAARRLNDLAGQAHTRRNLARAYARVGRFEEAHDHLRHALALHDERGDHVGQGRTHLSIAGAYERQGRHQEALDHSLRGLELTRVAGHRAGQARALNAVGWRYARLGEYREALTHCEEALVVLAELGDKDGQADTLDSLGYIHQHLGDHRRAVDCFQRALDLFRQAGDRHGEAETLFHLGEAHETAGRLDDALLTWQHALTILDDVGHPDAERVRTRLHDLAANARTR